MWANGRRAALWIRLAIAVAAVLGCGPSDSERTDAYLLRVGNRKITERHFLQAFELAKTAYPDSADQTPSALQDARRQLLEELTTELILLNRAEEAGVSVSEAELDSAIAAISADYPPGVFEQTLSEAAVPFEAWKQRMRSRLLLEKLVQSELGPRIAVTPEEVAGYYDQHYRGKAAAADSEEKFQKLKETIVADLRRKKLEEAFVDWINQLKEKYTVDLNSQMWAEISSRGQEPSPPPPAPLPEGK
jgi:FKBP-type peptidyl-prolyl cis-trans isomerase (trigger factor)